MDHIDECPVFAPTAEDLTKPFATFVEAREADCLAYGICKITPTAGWSPKYKPEEPVEKFTPSNQTFTLDNGAIGTYKAEISMGHSISLTDFAQERPDIRVKLSKLRTLSDFEHSYWKSLAGGTFQYGSDIDGSLFHPDFQVRHIHGYSKSSIAENPYTYAACC